MTIPEKSVVCRDIKINQELFLDYAQKFAVYNKTNILLGGSFAKGTATPFSDIDLYMFSEDETILHKFIYGYGLPVYISQTMNPKGIIIVIYEDGVALDLEIMKGDIYTGKYFALKDDNRNLAEINSEIADRLVVCKDQLYSIARLFHRSLIKYLSSKEEKGISILSEIAAALNLIYEHNKTYKQNYRTILDCFEQKYPLEKGYRTVLNNLERQIEKEKA